MIVPKLILDIYDQRGNKLCQLYDNRSDVTGQAYDVVLTSERNGWKELSFSLPAKIHTADGDEDNYRLQYLKTDNKIRFEDETKTDWFMISEQKVTHKAFSKDYDITAGHISQLLKVKNLGLEFSDEDGNNVGTAEELLTEILKGTGWTVGNVAKFYEDDGVREKVRSLKASVRTGAFKLITKMCDLFDAKPDFNGDTKTVDILPMNPFSEPEDGHLPDVAKADGVIELHYGTNISNVTRTIDTDSLITKLYAYGSYGDTTYGFCGIDEYYHRTIRMKAISTLTNISLTDFNALVQRYINEQSTAADNALFEQLKLIAGTRYYITMYDETGTKIVRNFVPATDITKDTVLRYSFFDPASMMYIYNETANEAYPVSEGEVGTEALIYEIARDSISWQQDDDEFNLEGPGMSPDEVIRIIINNAESVNIAITVNRLLKENGNWNVDEDVATIKYFASGKKIIEITTPYGYKMNVAYNGIGSADTEQMQRLIADTTIEILHKNWFSFLMDYDYYYKNNALSDECIQAIANYQYNAPALMGIISDSTMEQAQNRSKLSEYIGTLDFCKLDVLRTDRYTENETLYLNTSTYPDGIIYRTDAKERKDNQFKFMVATTDIIDEYGFLKKGTASLLYVIHNTNPVTWDTAYLLGVDNEENPTALTFLKRRGELHIQPDDEFYLFEYGAESGYLCANLAGDEAAYKSVRSTALTGTVPHNVYFFNEEIGHQPTEEDRSKYAWCWVYSSTIGEDGEYPDSKMYFCYGSKGDYYWNRVYYQNTDPSNDVTVSTGEYWMNYETGRLCRRITGGNWLALISQDEEQVGNMFSSIYTACRNRDRYLHGEYRRQEYMPQAGQPLPPGNYYIDIGYGRFQIFSTKDTLTSNTGDCLAYSLDDYGVIQKKNGVQELLYSETKSQNIAKYHSHNLFDSTTLTDGEYAADNSEIRNTANWYYTNQIRIYPNVNYTVSRPTSNISRVIFYDSKKRYLGYAESVEGTHQNYTFKTPDGCSYARLSAYMPSKSELIIFRANNYATDVVFNDISYTKLSPIDKTGERIGLITAMTRFKELAHIIYETNEITKINAQADLEALEASMANTLGDLYREGYWQDSNYVEGDEEKLYKDALKKIKQIAKPEAKYSIKFLDLQSAQPDDKDFGASSDTVDVQWPDISTRSAVHLVDPDIDVNTWAFVDKVKKCYDKPWETSISIDTKLTTMTQHSFGDVLSNIADVVSQTKYSLSNSIGSLSKSVSTGVSSAALQKILQYVNNNGTAGVDLSALSGLLDGSSLTSGSITTEKYGINSITDSSIDDEAIGTRHIQPNSIIAGLLAANSVDSDKIQNGSVTSDKISNGSVTPDKISDGEALWRTIAAAILQKQAEEDAQQYETDQKQDYRINAAVLNIEEILEEIGNLKDEQGRSIITQYVESDTIVSNYLESHQITANNIDTESLNAALITTDFINAVAGRVGQLTVDDLTTQTITTTSLEAVQAAIQDLTTNKLTSDEGFIGSLSSFVIEAMKANIENIETSHLDAQTLVSDLANIADARIDVANIAYSQITGLDATKALISKGVGNKLYINDLAVTDANIAKLSVGELMVKGDDGNFYQITPGEDSTLTTTLVQIENDNIADRAINAGEKIIEGSITAGELNVSDIFANNALIRELMASNIDVSTLFAREATINELNATDITGNSFIRMMAADGKVIVSTTEPTGFEGKTMWCDTSTSPYTLYYWDGDEWEPYIDMSVVSQTQEPAGLPDNTHWIDTANNNSLWFWDGLIWERETNCERSNTAPTDTSKYWVDTSGSSPVLKKYINGSWQQVTAFVSESVPVDTKRTVIWIDTSEPGPTMKKWDGTKWYVYTGLNGVVLYDDEQPVGPQDGTLWLDPSSETEELNRWDAVSHRWVNAGIATLKVDVDNIIGRVQSAEGAISELKIATDGISLAVQSASVVSKNIIADTDRTFERTMSDREGVVYKFSLADKSYLPKLIGADVALSYYVDCPGERRHFYGVPEDVGDNFGCKLVVLWGNSTMPNAVEYAEYLGEHIDSTITNRRTYQTATITPPENYDIIKDAFVEMDLFAQPADSNVTWTIGQPMLGFGTISGSYTRAEEEVTEETSARFQVLQNQITELVEGTQTFKDNVAGNNAAIAAALSKLYNALKDNGEDIDDDEDLSNVIAIIRNASNIMTNDGIFTRLSKATAYKTDVEGKINSSIKSVTTLYAVNESSINAPINGNFTYETFEAAKQAVQSESSCIWQIVKTTYNDSTIAPVYTKPVCVSDDASIMNSETQYCYTTQVDSSKLNEADWTSNAPDLTNADETMCLWTREKITYNKYTTDANGNKNYFVRYTDPVLSNNLIDSYVKVNKLERDLTNEQWRQAFIESVKDPDGNEMYTKRSELKQTAEGLTSIVQGLEDEVSQIRQTSKEILLSVGNVEDMLQNSSGSGNLIDGTDVTLLRDNDDNQIYIYKFDATHDFEKQSIVGKILTLSYDLDCHGERAPLITSSTNIEDFFGGYMLCIWRDSTGEHTDTVSSQCLVDCMRTANTVDRVKCSATITPPEGYDTLSDYSVIFVLAAKPAVQGTTWKIGRPKLEIGIFATEYTQSVNDNKAFTEAAYVRIIDEAVEISTSKVNAASEKVKDGLVAIYNTITSDVAERASIVAGLNDDSKTEEEKLGVLVGNIERALTVQEQGSQTSTYIGVKQYAQSAQTSADNAQASADAAQDAADAAQSSADAAQDAADDAQADINNVKKNYLKITVGQTDVDSTHWVQTFTEGLTDSSGTTLVNQISAIKQTADGVESRVAKFNGLVTATYRQTTQPMTGLIGGEIWYNPNSNVVKVYELNIEDPTKSKWVTVDQADYAKYGIDDPSKIQTRIPRLQDAAQNSALKQTANAIAAAVNSVSGTAVIPQGTNDVEAVATLMLAKTKDDIDDINDALGDENTSGTVLYRIANAESKVEDDNIVNTVMSSKVVRDGIGVAVFKQTTEPSVSDGVLVGDIWYDTTTASSSLNNKLVYIYQKNSLYKPGGSEQEYHWVRINPIIFETALPSYAHGDPDQLVVANHLSVQMNAVQQRTTDSAIITTITSSKEYRDALTSIYKQSGDPRTKDTAGNAITENNVIAGDLWIDTSKSTRVLKVAYAKTVNNQDVIDWKVVSAGDYEKYGIVLGSGETLDNIQPKKGKIPEQMAGLKQIVSEDGIKTILTGYVETDVDGFQSTNVYKNIMAALDDTITGVTTYYAQNQSTTQAPALPADWDNLGSNSPWNIQQPAKRDGYYIWSVNVTRYKGESVTPTTSGPVCISGTDGVDGLDGVNNYMHIRYSVNANGSGMVATPTAATKYMGVAVTTSTTAPTSYTAYKWSKYTGEDGANGSDGNDGVSSYTHIMYSANADGTDMVDTPTTATKYIGISITATQGAPTDKALYEWTKFVGDNGVNGTNGKDGANGISNYTFFRYSDYADGTDMVDIPTETSKYIGVAVATTSTAPTNKNKYTWSKYVGEDGINGVNGTNSFTHVRYSANANGSSMTTQPSSTTKYLGLVVTNSATAPTSYTAYTWTKFVGENGADGADGRDGTDGVSSYTYFRYSAQSDGTGMTASPSSTTKYIGICVTTSATAPTSKGSYTWSKFIGEDGADGTSVNILGSYDTVNDLTTAHPSGANGDAYLVDGDLYVWTGSQWLNAGTIQGPQGPQGPQGVGVTKVEVQYAQNTSTKTAPSSGWSTSEPTWQSGKYIWVRQLITYTDGSTAPSTAVLAKAYNAMYAKTLSIEEMTNIYNDVTKALLNGLTTDEFKEMEELDLWDGENDQAKMVKVVQDLNSSHGEAFLIKGVKADIDNIKNGTIIIVDQDYVFTNETNTNKIKLLEDWSKTIDYAVKHPTDVSDTSNTASTTFDLWRRRATRYSADSNDGEHNIANQVRYAYDKIPNGDEIISIEPLYYLVRIADATNAGKTTKQYVTALSISAWSTEPPTLPADGKNLQTPAYEYWRRDKITTTQVVSDGNGGTVNAVTYSTPAKDNDVYVAVVNSIVYTTLEQKLTDNLFRRKFTEETLDANGVKTGERISDIEQTAKAIELEVFDPSAGGSRIQQLANVINTEVYGPDGDLTYVKQFADMMLGRVQDTEGYAQDFLRSATYSAEEFDNPNSIGSIMQSTLGLYDAFKAEAIQKSVPGNNNPTEQQHVAAYVHGLNGIYDAMYGPNGELSTWVQNAEDWYSDYYDPNTGDHTKIAQNANRISLIADQMAHNLLQNSKEIWIEDHLTAEELPTTLYTDSNIQVNSSYSTPNKLSYTTFSLSDMPTETATPVDTRYFSWHQAYADFNGSSYTTGQIGASTVVMPNMTSLFNADADSFYIQAGSSTSTTMKLMGFTTNGDYVDILTFTLSNSTTRQALPIALYKSTGGYRNFFIRMLATSSSGGWTTTPFSIIAAKNANGNRFATIMSNFDRSKDYSLTLKATGNNTTTFDMAIMDNSNNVLNTWSMNADGTTQQKIITAQTQTYAAGYKLVFYCGPQSNTGTKAITLTNVSLNEYYDTNNYYRVLYDQLEASKTYVLTLESVQRTLGTSTYGAYIAYPGGGTYLQENQLTAGNAYSNSIEFTPSTDGSVYVYPDRPGYCRDKGIVIGSVTLQKQPEVALQHGNHYEVIKENIVPATYFFSINGTEYDDMTSNANKTDAVITYEFTDSSSHRYTFVVPRATRQQRKITITQQCELRVYAGKRNNTRDVGVILREVQLEYAEADQNNATAWGYSASDERDTFSNGVVTVDHTGVQISGGIVDIHAGSEFNVDSDGVVKIQSTIPNSMIQFGEDANNMNFQVSQSGEVWAKTVDATNLYQNGVPITLLIQNMVDAAIARKMAEIGQQQQQQQQVTTKTYQGTITSQSAHIGSDYLKFDVGKTYTIRIADVTGGGTVYLGTADMEDPTVLFANMPTNTNQVVENFTISSGTQYLMVGNPGTVAFRYEILTSNGGNLSVVHHNQDQQETGTDQQQASSTDTQTVTTSTDPKNYTANFANSWTLMNKVDNYNFTDTLNFNGSGMTVASSNGQYRYYFNLRYRPAELIRGFSGVSNVTIRIYNGTTSLVICNKSFAPGEFFAKPNGGSYTLAINSYPDKDTDTYRFDPGVSTVNMSQFDNLSMDISISFHSPMDFINQNKNGICSMQIAGS